MSADLRKRGQQDGSKRNPLPKY